MFVASRFLPCAFRVCSLLMACVLALSAMGEPIDSIPYGNVAHRVEVEAVPATVLHTNSFLKGENELQRPVNSFNTLHVKYAFQYQNNQQARIYRGAYQGLGAAYHKADRLVGSPLSVFLFQGAPVMKLSRRMSLNYEWKLGLAYGWKTPGPEDDIQSSAFGSKATAYMNAQLYLNYRLNRYADLAIGASAAHFSNGNTAYPNAGLNSIGLRAGVAYYFNREEEKEPVDSKPHFRKHVSYDAMVYGAWCTRGLQTAVGPYLHVPGTCVVVGFNVAAMYNMSHYFNAGLSIDGVYDKSANTEVVFRDGYYDFEGSKQAALGISARGELVMPWFTINAGIGTNVVNARNDFSGLYEVLALKIRILPPFYLNIGYTLRKFKDPDHLMFGIGYQFSP